jgi:hypothetical protein
LVVNSRSNEEVACRFADGDGIVPTRVSRPLEPSRGVFEETLSDV